MKILVVSHMYPSSYNPGYGSFVHAQAKALAEKGVEIRVVSPVPRVPFPFTLLSPKWAAYRERPEAETIDSIQISYPRILSFPYSLFFASSGWRTYMGIRRQVASLHDGFRFDLIHAHTALPDGFAALKIGEEYNKPVFVTVHGADLQEKIHRNHGCRQSISHVLENATKTICVSRKLHDAALPYTKKPHRLTVIANGIDPATCKVGVSGSIKKSGGGVLMLSVSNLIRTKGIDLNLRAFQRLYEKHPFLRYIVVGAGPQEAILRKLVKDLRIQNNVEFVGRQPPSRVMDYMAECDIFSLPSWEEGFGIVYLEAMASGKPVIGCKGEGIEDFVEHGRTGLLVNPQDVDSLVEALEFLIAQPKRAEQIGAQGRKLVFDKYTWEENAEITMRLYKNSIEDFPKLKAPAA